MLTTSPFVAKPVPQEFRGFGSRVDVHEALVKMANEDGIVYTTYADFADAAGVTPQVARRTLAWLQEQDLITYRPGNRGRKGIVQLVPEVSA